MMTFFQPVWLLLLLPLVVAWFVWPPPNRWLRAFVFLLVVAGLAQLAIKLPDHAGTVVVVADRSESMPASSVNSEKEVIDLLHKSMKVRDQLGVVSFAREAVVEHPPQRAEFAGFKAQIGTEHSRLNEAIESALGLIPPDAGGRILLLSDGKWTGKDPIAAAARAASRGIAVDFRVLGRPQVNDIAIQSFLTPDSVLPDQSFVLSAWVQSPAEQEIQYQLKRGSKVISSGAKQVSPGLNRLMFRDRASKAGVEEYTVSIQGAQGDPIPENNSARALVGVEGSLPVLVVAEAGANSGLVKLLHAGGIDLVAKTPGECIWSLESLSGFSAVLIENVSANLIGESGMETMASWVEESSGGLMMTGGQKSYGPGGYFKSPLERVMPISMEMRREHRKMSLAISVSLDRSGSMAVPVSGGRVKMDLANLGTVQVLDLLSPMDEISVFAVDSAPHEIVPMDTVEKNTGYRGKILAIDSMGGGIFVYEALVAAARSVGEAKAATKHIILFADAADSEEPGDYINLIQKCRDAGVTISVIGLGTDADSDAALLKDIASRGGGECYFSDNPDEIPRLFAQDTFTVARSTFIDQPTPFSITAGFSLLGSMNVNTPPPALGGYNLCYIRPEANLAAVTLDEHQSPVVASWNAGNGRVVSYMGEADGKFSGDLTGWNQTGEFYSTLMRWVAGKRQALPDDMLLTQKVREGVCILQLHLDPARKTEPFSTLPKVKVLHGVPGSAPLKQTYFMQWKNADLLEVNMPINGRETMLSTVEVAGQQAVTLPPVCLPYSPEFAPDQPGRGLATLSQIAATTGGAERIEIPGIWNDLPVKPHHIVLSPWLLIAAALLFLLEVFDRHTGWITRLLGRKRPALAGGEETPTSSGSSTPGGRKLLFPWLARKASKKVAPSPTVEPVTATPVKGKPEASLVNPPEEVSAIDALRKARERASRRTDKKQ